MTKETKQVLIESLWASLTLVSLFIGGVIIANTEGYYLILALIATGLATTSLSMKAFPHTEEINKVEENNNEQEIRNEIKRVEEEIKRIDSILSQFPSKSKLEFLVRSTEATNSYQHKGE